MVKKKTTLGQFKQQINSMFVWVLVVINVVLIASMVQKLITGTNIPDSNIADIDFSEPLKVEVLNGCGVAGLANEFAEFLRTEKFDVVNVGNAPGSDFDYEKSLVFNRSHKTEKRIKKLCDVLGISEDKILNITNDALQTDATFIIGHDYTKLKSFKRMH